MDYTKGEWRLDDTGTAVFVKERLVANCGGFSLSQHESETLAENKANAHLIVAAPDMHKKLSKVRAWLMRLAEKAESEAKTATRFITLQDAYIADGKMYRATIADIDIVLAKAEGK